MIPERLGIGRSATAPLLLVVGAQKSGTATITEDLRACQNLHVPDDIKEASGLCWNPSLPLWSLRYAWQWRSIGPGQVAVDVSTRYTMAPRVKLPHLATLAGSKRDVRVVYVLRDPLERAISHHHHDTLLGLCSEPADAAMTNDSAFVANSCYGRQLQVWAEHIAPENIKLIAFDHYVENRNAVISELCDWLGVSDEGVDQIGDEIHNQSEGRPVFGRLVAGFVRSPVYRVVLRRLLPERFRQVAKERSSSTGAGRPAPPSSATIDRIAEIFRADNELLRSIEPSAPVWRHPR